MKATQQLGLLLEFCEEARKEHLAAQDEGSNWGNVKSTLCLLSP